MGSHDTNQCCGADSEALERLRYFPRQLLTADDMRVEQEYFLEKLRRHNRFLHGWGVVCGLRVQPDPASGPLALTICPGYALSPCGNEIYVPQPVRHDLTEDLRKLKQPSCLNPCPPGVELGDKQLVILVCYTECQTRPIRTMPAGCGCDDTACEYSRIRDSFEIRSILQPKLRAEEEKTPGICEIERDIDHLMPPCPPKPACDGIRLATIPLGGDLTPDMKAIDNRARNILYSVSQIQTQVIHCCCET